MSQTAQPRSKPYSGKRSTPKSPSECDLGQLEGHAAVVLLHGLLMAFAAYAALSAYAESSSNATLIVLALVLLSHATLYVLPDGYAGRRYYEHLLIALGVTTTAGWLLVLSLEGSLGYLAGVSAILAIPLVWRRLTVWVTTTAVLVGLVLIAKRMNWLEVSSEVRDLEFLVLHAFLLVWMVYAFLFETLKSQAQLSALLEIEKARVRVLERFSAGLAAATGVEDVFSVVSGALAELIDARELRLALVDPIRWTGSVALSASETEDRGETLDLDEGMPLRTALESRKTVSIYRHSSPPETPDSIAIAVDSGFGIVHVIYGQIERAVDDDTVALLEGIAEATASTMRGVQLFGQTKEQAQTDSLTGLPNRGSFQAMVNREFERAKRHGRSLSLLIVDLDFLKNINDRYGHPMGDIVIREAADRIVAALRGSDHLAARYGGEEFAVILPETGSEGGTKAGQRICDAIAAASLPTIGQFTASIGVATYPLNAISKEELVKAADEALYKAKNAGRNRVATSELVLRDSTTVA